MQFDDAKLLSGTKTVPAVGKVTAQVPWKMQPDSSMKKLPKVKIRCTVKCIKTGAKRVKKASKFSFYAGEIRVWNMVQWYCSSEMACQEPWKQKKDSCPYQTRVSMNCSVEMPSNDTKGRWRKAGLIHAQIPQEQCTHSLDPPGVHSGPPRIELF